MTHLSKSLKKWIVFSVVTTFIVVFLAVVSALSLKAPSFLVESPIRLLWIIFAFVSGVFMLGSSSIYPLAINISTIDNENKKAKSYLKVAAFILSTIILLSAFGVLLPKISSMAYFDKFDFSKALPRLYFVLGLLVYIVSLCKMNVLPLLDTIVLNNFSRIMRWFGSTFGVVVFVFISFFAEVIPSTWMLFMESGLGQNVEYGLILFSAHAAGRIIFVLAMQVIATFGINSSSWLAGKKSSFKSGLNITTVIFSSIIVSMGLTSILSTESGLGQMVFTLSKSGWLILLMLIVPLWVTFFREEDRIHGTCKKDLFVIRAKITEILDETHRLEVLNKDSSRTILSYIEKLKKKVGELGLINKILESSLRHGCKTSIRATEEQKEEEWRLKRRLIETIFLTLIAITIVSIFALG